MAAAAAGESASADDAKRPAPRPASEAGTPWSMRCASGDDDVEEEEEEEEDDDDEECDEGGTEEERSAAERADIGGGATADEVEEEEDVPEDEEELAEDKDIGTEGTTSSGTLESAGIAKPALSSPQTSALPPPGSPAASS